MKQFSKIDVTYTHLKKIIEYFKHLLCNFFFFFNVHKVYILSVRSSGSTFFLFK